MLRNYQKIVVFSGLMGPGLIVVCALVTALFYHGRLGEPYSPLNHFISELGERGVSTWAPLFNTGLMVGGLLLSLFMIALGRYLGTLPGYLAATVGGVAGLACSAVGLFPMDNLPRHLMASFSFFYSGMIAIGLFTFAVAWQSQRRLPRWLMVPGGLATAAFAVFLALPHVTGTSHRQLLDPSQITRPDIWAKTILEWSVFVTVLAWVLLVSIAVARTPYAGQSQENLPLDDMAALENS